MRRPILPVLALALLAGCSAQIPVAPVRTPTSERPHTFVLRSFDDSRLPAPLAEALTSADRERSLARVAPPDGFTGGPGADPASYWNRLTTELGLASRLAPPLFARAYALTHTAIHDALVAATDGRRGRLAASAVAAGAASTVLAYLFPSEAERIETLAAEQANLRNPLGAAARGFALGRAVGELVVDHGRHDRSDSPWDGQIPSGPGSWTGANPVLPMCGTWRCWVIDSGAEFQPEPPYPYGSPEDLADVEAVYQASLQRTPEQIAIVHKWADLPPPTLWNGHLLERVGRDRLGASPSARAFAFLNVTMFDAFVSCWKTKYTYWTARPFQRVAGLVTVIPTPNFPSYTSGHSTVSGAAAEVMSELFPGEAQLFRAEAEEAALSRFWGGIHFHRDDDQGLVVGRAIGRKVVERMRGAAVLARR